MIIGNNLNLNKNQIQNALLHPLSAAPNSPAAGQVYFNTLTKKLYYYDGTSWIVVEPFDASEYALKSDIGNATITIQKNGTSVNTFTTNQSNNKSINITLSKSDVGLSNVDNVKQYSSSNPNFGTTAPVMDGTASVGSATTYARSDHIHPTDTSRAPINHASNNTTYGVSTTSNYGHVKIDNGDLNGATSVDGVAAGIEHTHSQYLLISGGSLTGNLTIGGNLTVNGTTTTIESQTLAVKDKLIEVAKDNTTTLTSPAGLLVKKYDGTNSGALVFDGTGTAYVGDVTLDSSGNINVSSSNLVALAARAASNTFTNGHIAKWNSTSSIFEDSGLAYNNLVTRTTEQSISGVKTFAGSTFFTSTIWLTNSTDEGHISNSSYRAYSNNTSATEYSSKQIYVFSNVSSGNYTTLTLPTETGTLALTKNVVDLTSSQTISGTKTFKTLLVGGTPDTGGLIVAQGDDATGDVLFKVDEKGIDLDADGHNIPLLIGGNSGTLGQVLTSQGEGSAPKWSTITIPSNIAKKYSTSFTGDGSTTSFSYSHGLNSANLSVSLYKTTSGTNELVLTDIEITSTTIKVIFAQAPSTSDTFTLVAIG